MASRTLVLHSGGMDSTVCLLRAAAAGNEVVSLGIDYGQKSAVELVFAARQCAARRIKREVLSVGWSKPARTIPKNREVSTMPVNLSSAFLPARNVVFLSLACAHAVGVGADQVHIGLNCVNFSGYPDCTVEFVDAFKAMMGIASPNGPMIVAPLLTLTKPQIALQAKNLGIKKDETWSCYDPQVAESNMVPCLACDACRLHDYAWRDVE